MTTLRELLGDERFIPCCDECVYAPCPKHEHPSRSRNLAGLFPLLVDVAEAAEANQDARKAACEGAYQAGLSALSPPRHLLAVMIETEKAVVAALARLRAAAGEPLDTGHAAATVPAQEKTP